MGSLTLLLCYAGALVGASLAGGALPRLFAMTHTRTQLAMSLVSGLMLGIAFFHLLPHAVLALESARGLNGAMVWVMLGLVIMLLLLRMLHFHQPDYALDVSHCGHEHHDHEHHDHGHIDAGMKLPTARAGWRGVLIGLGFHAIIDGIALGAAVLAVPHGHQEGLLAFGVFLAILLHKPLDAMSITALMKSGGVSERDQRRINWVFALICPVAALTFYAWAMALGDVSTSFVTPALAFSAGAFICIALSDLLPEVQFHSHDRVKLTLVFLVGISLAYLLASSDTGHSHPVASAAVSAVE